MPQMGAPCAALQLDQRHVRHFVNAADGRAVCGIAVESAPCAAFRICRTWALHVRRRTWRCSVAEECARRTWSLTFTFGLRLVHMVA